MRVCQKSHISFHLILYIYRGGASPWRVCYQRVLPRLVLWYLYHASYGLPNTLRRILHIFLHCLMMAFGNPWHISTTCLDMLKHASYHYQINWQKIVGEKVYILRKNLWPKMWQIFLRYVKSLLKLYNIFIFYIEEIHKNYNKNVFI